MNSTGTFFVLLTLVSAGILNLSGEQIPTATSSAPANLSPGVLEIIRMSQAGVPSDMMVKSLESSGTPIKLTSDDLIALKGAKVSDEVIRAAAGAPQQPSTLAGRAPTAQPVPTPSPQPRQVLPTGVTDLRSVRKIFVEKMPEDLDQYIRAEITKQFKGSVVVVLKEEAADAILTGVGEKKDGIGAAVTGRYLGLHDNSTGAVSLVDRAGTVVLWSSEAGDRSLFWGALKRGGPRKVADRLMNNLKKAMGS